MPDFEVTYEIAKGPPPIEFEDYQDDALERYRKLLDEATGEQELQQFLEQNPSFVPGGRTPMSGHLPKFNALFTQPLLPGFDARKPDFMWLAKNSLTTYITLIEIESPTKMLFTKDGQQQAKFTQAHRQLKDWRIWFDDSDNRSLFLKNYGIPASDMSSNRLELRLLLVYGRSAEFENDAALSRRRGELLNPPDEDLMSFDRLRPDKSMESTITVHNRGRARFEVKWIPETFRIRPSNIRKHIDMKGLAEAVQRNPRISQERRDFLAARFPYWLEWKHGSDTKHRLSNLGDFE